MKDAALVASSGELGEVALDGVEPGPNLGVLMGGVIVEDDMDGFVDGGLCADQV